MRILTIFYMSLLIIIQVIQADDNYIYTFDKRVKQLDTLIRAAGDKLVILFFSTNYKCIECLKLEHVLRIISRFTSVRVIKINYETYHHIFFLHDVDVAPTIILMKDSIEKRRVVGGNINELNEAVKNMTNIFDNVNLVTFNDTSVNMTMTDS